MTQDTITDNRAIKLIDFYEGLLRGETQLPQLETVEAEKASPMLRDLGPIKDAWMAEWIKQWRES